MSGDSRPGDTIVERSGSSTVKNRLLLDANRWLVTAGLMGVVFAGLVVAALLSPVSVQVLIGERDPIETVFQALVTALITGVTLVVAINSLVLSQELGAVEDQRERLAGAMDFRRDVETAIDAPIGPPEPSAFVQAIVAATEERAIDFREAVGDDHDPAFADQVDEYVDSLTTHSASIGDALEGAEFGTYEVLQAALDYNYSWKIFRLRRLRLVHAESLSDEAAAAYDDLLEALELFGLAREHFKTLYFQWELINLSRAMMYLAVPALIVTLSTILFFDASAVSGSSLGVENFVWILLVAATIAVAPFLLLIAFILRIATVAKRTLAIGPFILRESNRGEELDWETE